MSALLFHFEIEETGSGGEVMGWDGGGEGGRGDVGGSSDAPAAVKSE